MFLVGGRKVKKIGPFIFTKDRSHGSWYYNGMKKDLKPIALRFNVELALTGDPDYRPSDSRLLKLVKAMYPNGPNETIIRVFNKYKALRDNNRKKRRLLNLVDGKTKTSRNVDPHQKDWKLSDINETRRRLSYDPLTQKVSFYLKDLNIDNPNDKNVTRMRNFQKVKNKTRGNYDIDNLTTTMGNDKKKTKEFLDLIESIYGNYEIRDVKRLFPYYDKLTNRLTDPKEKLHEVGGGKNRFSKATKKRLLEEERLRKERTALLNDEEMENDEELIRNPPIRPPQPDIGRIPILNDNNDNNDNYNYNDQYHIDQELQRQQQEYHPLRQEEDVPSLTDLSDLLNNDDNNIVGDDVGRYEAPVDSNQEVIEERQSIPPGLGKRLGRGKDGHRYRPEEDHRLEEPAEEEEEEEEKEEEEESENNNNHEDDEAHDDDHLAPVNRNQHFNERPNTIQNNENEIIKLIESDLSNKRHELKLRNIIWNSSPKMSIETYIKKYNYPKGRSYNALSKTFLVYDPSDRKFDLNKEYKYNRREKAFWTIIIDALNRDIYNHIKDVIIINPNQQVAVARQIDRYGGMPITYDLLQRILRVL